VGKGTGTGAGCSATEAESHPGFNGQAGSGAVDALCGIAGGNPTSEDNIPLLVTNALLGGSFASRITSNIREQKGYTYSPSSQVSRRYHDAYWAEIADVTTKSTDHR